MFFKALILGRTGVCRGGKSNRARPAQVVKGQVFDSQFLAGGLEDPVDEVGRIKVACAADVTEHKYAVSGRSSSLRALTISEQLGLEDLSVKWVGAKEKFVLGDLIVTHGSIVRQRSGYTAHGELFHRGRSGISGHTHRLSSVWHTTDRGQLRWVEAGCLCRLNPEYGVDRTPDWQHGLVVGHLFEAHDVNRFDLTIVSIENGLAHYQGRLYSEKEILTA